MATFKIQLQGKSLNFPAYKKIEDEINEFIGLSPNFLEFKGEFILPIIDDKIMPVVYLGPEQGQIVQKALLLGNQLSNEILDIVPKP